MNLEKLRTCKKIMTGGAWILGVSFVFVLLCSLIGFEATVAFLIFATVVVGFFYSITMGVMFFDFYDRFLTAAQYLVKTSYADGAKRDMKNLESDHPKFFAICSWIAGETTKKETNE